MVHAHFLAKYSIVVLILCNALGIYANSNQLTDLSQFYIDFDESMIHGFTETEYKQLLLEKPQSSFIPLLKQMYQYSNFLTRHLERNKRLGIPRIIHQIWLGSKLPDQYKKFQRSWKKLHPDWEYRLWTDDDVESFGLVNKEAFDKARNYGEKANIFRYEILFRYGGLYIDTDFECLKSFEILNQQYEFYTGLVTLNRKTLINNGLIGSVPQHPILKACIDNIKNKKVFGNGRGQFNKNGTIFFGYTVIETCQNKQLDVSKIFIAPPTYFYPWPGPEYKKPLNEYILDSSFAIHYWDCSWSRYSKKKMLQD
ncbi:MAG TPA: glycosyltransferase [Candidatus Babeliales bacterium]|nr:glycosyltransferase [Candidatus Babeliales bacterium]